MSKKTAVVPGYTASIGHSRSVSSSYGAIRVSIRFPSNQHRKMQARRLHHLSNFLGARTKHPNCAVRNPRRTARWVGISLALCFLVCSCRIRKLRGLSPNQDHPRAMSMRRSRKWPLFGRISNPKGRRACPKHGFPPPARSHSPRSAVWVRDMH